MLIFEKELLSPDTWVNVWSINWMNRAEFYCCCQVQDIDDNELDHYALEPVDENGIPIEAASRELGVGRRASDVRTQNKTQLPTPNSQFPTPNSQLPIPNSQLPTPNSQFPTPNSQLPTPNSDPTEALKKITY